MTYKRVQIPLVFSSILHQRLPSVLEQQDMEQYLKLTHVSEEQQRMWALQDAVVAVTPETLRDTFIKVHEEFLAKDMVCEPSSVAHSAGFSLEYVKPNLQLASTDQSHALQDSGTTATVVVLCGAHVITANVGDSLAYADLGTRVQQLTTSHRIDENTSEQRRIKCSGTTAPEWSSCSPAPFHASVAS